MTKKVNIVCDCCGDKQGTTEFIERLARVYNVPTDTIHEVLYEDKGKAGVPRMTLEGCHVERIAEDSTA